MTTHEAMILSEALRRMEALAVPPSAPWQQPAHQEQVEHGPAYAVGWFGDVPNYDRQLFRRAIASLEQTGLLVPWSRYGRRLTNIQLTPAGLEVAHQLRQEAAQPQTAS